MTTRGHHGIMLGGAVGAFPVLLSITQADFPTASNSKAVPMPAAVTLGDLLVMAITFRAVGGVNATPTTPGGWTTLTGGNTGAGAATVCQLYYKVAAGTEGGTTVSVSTASSTTTAASQVFRVQVGTFSSTPSGTSAADAGANMTPDPPSHASGFGGLNALWLVGFGSNGSASPLTWPYPDNNTTTAALGTDPVRVITCTAISSAGTLNPAAFNMVATTRWRAFTVAIRPI